jgi:dihydrodipicolinate synthase/N-acetylneuraminate lyase
MRKVHLSAAVLVQIHEATGAQAVKDSSGDLIRTQQFIHSSGLDVFQENERLYLSSLLVGAAGCVSGGVCVVVLTWLPGLVAAFRDGELGQAMEIRHRITKGIMALLVHPNWAQVWRQCIHHVWGFDMGRDIMGYAPLREEEKTAIRKALKGLGAI